jgi:tetratricopeptide (TPR) repeat protein
MAEVEFIFWESIKALALMFMALLALKSAAHWAAQERGRDPRRAGTIRILLYTLVAILVALGAYPIGVDIAAEIYDRASLSNLRDGQLPRAYANAARAVAMRPAQLGYWQTLARVKLAGRQYESLLEDEPAFRALSHGQLDEDDEVHFGFCHLFLGHYEQAAATGNDLIRKDRLNPLAYLLAGAAYTDSKNYSQAERVFLAFLQFVPTQTDAVVGLAHAYFLEGHAARAEAVLDATAKYPFPPEARRRFEALKALYAQ